MWLQEELMSMKWRQYLTMICHRMKSIMYTGLEELDEQEELDVLFHFVSGKEVYKLKEIQRYCKTKIYAQKVPSLNDVANTKIDNVLEEIEKMIEK